MRGVIPTPHSISESSGSREGAEPSTDETEIKEIFSLHRELYTKLDSIIASMRDLLPIMDDLSVKINHGVGQDRRLGARLRIPMLMKTMGVALSHLNRAVKSARIASDIEQDVVDEVNLPRPRFE
jgi:hypothetical protein